MNPNLLWLFGYVAALLTCVFTSLAFGRVYVVKSTYDRLRMLASNDGISGLGVTLGPLVIAMPIVVILLFIGSQNFDPFKTILAISMFAVFFPFAEMLSWLYFIFPQKNAWKHWRLKLLEGIGAAFAATMGYLTFYLIMRPNS